MSKKVPLKTKAKGMVGKPAEPTVAPGGSVAAAAWVAGAGCVVAGAAGVADEPPEEELARGGAGRGRRRRSQQAPRAPRPPAGVGPWPPPPEIFSEVKSIRAECATDCSW